GRVPGRGSPPSWSPTGVPVGSCGSGARRDLGVPDECRVDSGPASPAPSSGSSSPTAPSWRRSLRKGRGLHRGRGHRRGQGHRRGRGHRRGGGTAGAGPPQGGACHRPGPRGATSAQPRCRARGVPGVELNWERLGHPLGNGELGLEFQSHQWREGPWTSSILTLPNVTGARSRLRHQFHQFHQFQQSQRAQGGGATPRPRYRYQNVPQGPDWEHWERWEGDGTLGSFVCVATNGRGTARREMRLRLGDRPDPPQSLRLSGVSPTSLSLEWHPGFDGGLQQHFLLR
ncbi:uncharacterized protein LOC126635059, partial [Myiozetetes cayanensis]|uniref:uncharacterized protein LOC126635059 n=1 Tax=Myiozetetes cayanensis TaxID=478635 RepID=UPI00215F63E9